jgi:hypothetical protein
MLAMKNEVRERFQHDTSDHPSSENIFVSIYQKLWLSTAIPPQAEGRTRRHDTRGGLRWT